MTPDDVANIGGDDELVITDQQLYDHATKKEPLPEPEPQARAPASQEQQAAPEPVQQSQRQRDEQGRFVAGQAPPQPPPAQSPPAQQPQQQQPVTDGRVPLRELMAERERAQRAEQEANQMRQAWAQIQAQQQAYAQQQAMAAQQQQAPQLTIFDNPDQYIRENYIAPLIQQLEFRERYNKDLTSIEIAKTQFHPQEINAAVEAMRSIRHTPQGETLYWQIMNSGHPYGALVGWFRQARQQAQIQAEIGPDVNAWKQKQRDAWLNDEAMQAEAAKRYMARQRQTNGRAPTVNLPPSLQSFPASSGRMEAVGDLSDESLYAHATRARRT